MAARPYHVRKVRGSSPRLAPMVVCITMMLAGCAPSYVRTRPMPLPLPSRPVLQPVPASSVVCLSDATYTRLVNRERALRNWGLQLEAVIRTNNEHAHKER